jgi:hypothetical protein
MVLGITLALAVATPTTASAAGGGALPPARRAALVKIFGPEVEPLGLRITRAALVNPATDRRTARGAHLALYVEPTGAYSDDAYLAGTVDVTRVFLPSVFRRWPGLRSFDVCQEPSPAVDDRPEPPPETQVFVLRRGLDLVDWGATDLAQLMVVSAHAADTARGGHVPFSLYVADRLQASPAYQDALARSRTGQQTGPAANDPYR